MNVAGPLRQTNGTAASTDGRSRKLPTFGFCHNSNFQHLACLSPATPGRLE